MEIRGIDSFMRILAADWPHGDAFLVAVLSNLPQPTPGHPVRIKGLNAIVSAFSKASLLPEFQEGFPYAFDRDGLNATSNDIDDFIYCLEASGLLQRDEKEFILTDALAARYQRFILPKLTEEMVAFSRNFAAAVARDILGSAGLAKFSDPAAVSA